MRIRSIKPEFWRSEDITSLTWHDRLLFIGLWSYVDDNGVGVDKLHAIAADLFAGDLMADARETFARVSRGLQTLSARGLITRYDVAGKPYLHIDTWADHQRIDKPAKDRHPLPTCGNALIREGSATPSRDRRESVAPGTGEQGSSGAVKNPSSTVADAEIREDVEALCSRLADGVEGNGSKRPTITRKWRDSARLMLDRDGRRFDEALALIDWCQADSFWRANVLSMPTFRDQYDKLRLRSQQPRPHEQSAPSHIWEAS